MHNKRAIDSQLKDARFTVRVAKTSEEDRRLIETGIEYVNERDGAKIYRKRKPCHLRGKRLP